MYKDVHCTYKRILVPLDGSELAEAILGHVEQAARAFGAEVIALTVLPATGVVPDLAREDIVQATSYLDGIKQRLTDKGLKAQTAIRYGDPADEIIDYAQVNDIDLIAMSTHGRSGISHLIFGSVSEKVLRGTSKPILLIRSPQPE